MIGVSTTKARTGVLTTSNIKVFEDRMRSVDTVNNVAITPLNTALFIAPVELKKNVIKLLTSNKLIGNPVEVRSELDKTRSDERLQIG